MLVLMVLSCFNRCALDSVTLAKLLVARQDALAQAEELRHAALEREQQLITEVAQSKLEKDSLSQVGFSPYCHRICPAQSWADLATQAIRDLHSTWKQLRAEQTTCTHLVEPVTMHYSRNKQRYVEFRFCTWGVKMHPIATVAGMQVHSVRETNRLLDGKLQQLQSQLHGQAASTKQARVRC